MEPLKKCPICGSRKVQRVCETVELHPRGEALLVPELSFDRCQNCGEMFFDHDASTKIDAAVALSKRSPARRKSA